MLTRVRACGQLSTEQEADWGWFADNWDRVNAEAHGKEWARLFAEIVQGVADKLKAGESNALSQFMASESQRVLAGVPGLRLLGALS